MIKHVWHFSQGQHKRLVLSLIAIFMANLAALMGPYIMGEVFNAIQAGGAHILKNVAFWLMMLGAAEVLYWVFNGPARVIEREISFSIRGQFYEAVYQKLRTLPLKWHQDHHSGDTINRTRKAGDALFSFAESNYIHIATLIGLLGPIAVLFYLSWPVAVVALSLNIIILAALWRFDKAIIRWLDLENQAEHRFSATLFDYMANFTTIITLRLGGRTQEELKKRYQHIVPNFKPHVKLNEWKYFILTMGATLLGIIVMLVYIWHSLSHNGVVMVGTAVAIYRYLDMLRTSFYGFAGSFQAILKQHTDFSSIKPILNAPAQPLLPVVPQTPENWTSFALSNLSFNHNAEATTVKNIALSARKGQWIALVGESGAGKSTLMALLRGLYEPQSCTLKIDGKKAQSLAVLREMTTLIPQEPEIFENSISYNITVGLNHTEEDLNAALKLARFDVVLKKLPHGLETDVREKGVNLSGGEKQRLALARGLFAAKGSDIILLDEATSSIDIHNEMAIFNNIKQAYPDKVVISSVHKLNLIQFFDIVYVMDKGTVVEHGTVEDLLAQPNSAFGKLWQRYQEKR